MKTGSELSSAQCNSLTHFLDDLQADQLDENQFIITPSDKIFQNEALASPFEEKASKAHSTLSLKSSDKELSQIEKSKVEAASMILELNEQALASFGKEDIEKAFLSFKKCQGLLSKSH